MLEKVRRLFGELHGGSKQSGHYDADDYRVAAAALLVHVATLDHDLTGPARQKLGALLMAQFSLTDALTDELIEAAVAADREAVDFYHYYPFAHAHPRRTRPVTRCRNAMEN